MAEEGGMDYGEFMLYPRPSSQYSHFSEETEFGPRVQWIGWQFHVTAGYLSLPQSKIDKLAEYLSSMRKSSRTSKKSLEKLVGLLNWITQVFRLMRCW